MDEVLAIVEAGAQGRAEDHRRHVHLPSRRHRARRLPAAVGPDGGYDGAYKRLQDPATRKKIAEAVRTPTKDWENLYLAAGSPDRILLVGFKSEKLKPLTGKTLAEVAKMRGKDPVETIMDLMLEDDRASVRSTS